MFNNGLLFFYMFLCYVTNKRFLRPSDSSWNIQCSVKFKVAVTVMNYLSLSHHIIYFTGLKRPYSLPGGSDTAPLATAEGTEEAEMETIPPMIDEQKEGGEGFCILESAPAGHRFRLSMLQPSEPRTFYSAVKREIKLLKSDLPPGVSSFFFL